MVLSWPEDPLSVRFPLVPAPSPQFEPLAGVERHSVGALSRRSWFPLTGQPDLSPLWCSSEPPREGVDPREDPKRPSTNPGADPATGHSGRAGRSHNLRPVALATVEAEEQGVVQAERVVKGANPRSAYSRASALVLSIDAWRPSMMTACPVGS